MHNRAAAWIVGSLSFVFIIGCNPGGSGESLENLEAPKIVPGECFACKGSGKLATFGQSGGTDGAAKPGGGTKPTIERPTNPDGTPMTPDQFRSGAANVPGMELIDCISCNGTGKTEKGEELPESADQAGRAAGGQGGQGGPGGN